MDIHRFSFSNKYIDLAFLFYATRIARGETKNGRDHGVQIWNIYKMIQMKGKMATTPTDLIILYVCGVNVLFKCKIVFEGKLCNSHTRFYEEKKTYKRAQIIIIIILIQ